MDDTTAQHVLSEITREVETHLLATRAQHPARWATGNLMNEGWRLQLTQTYLLLKLLEQGEAHMAYIRERDAGEERRHSEAVAANEAWKAEIRAQHTEAMEAGERYRTEAQEAWRGVEERKLVLQEEYLTFERKLLNKQGKALTEMLERMVGEHIDRMFAANETQALEEVKDGQATHV